MCSSNCIYLNEYKKYLSDKATFFVPEYIEQRIENYGNKELYNNQKINFDLKTITDTNLLKLIYCIHKYRKGLEQEIFILEQVKQEISKRNITE